MKNLKKYIVKENETLNYVSEKILSNNLLEHYLAKIPSIIRKFILFVSLKKLFIVFFSKL